MHQCNQKNHIDLGHFEFGRANRVDVRSREELVYKELRAVSVTVQQSSGVVSREGSSSCCPLLYETCCPEHGLFVVCLVAGSLALSVEMNHLFSYHLNH